MTLSLLWNDSSQVWEPVHIIITANAKDREYTQPAAARTLLIAATSRTYVFAAKTRGTTFQAT